VGVGGDGIGWSGTSGSTTTIPGGGGASSGGDGADGGVPYGGTVSVSYDGGGGYSGPPGPVGGGGGTLPSVIATANVEKTQKVPRAPAGVDIDVNIAQASSHRDDILGDIWFYNQVRNHGPWDYKQQARACGVDYVNPYEDFGNFNYGATGAAMGYGDQFLLRMAGWANTRADPARTGLGSWYGRAPYGDDAKDQAMIRAGIMYYYQHGGRRHTFTNPFGCGYAPFCL
jgi:hypothetical protein